MAVSSTIGASSFDAIALHAAKIFDMAARHSEMAESGSEGACHEALKVFISAAAPATVTGLSMAAGLVTRASDARQAETFALRRGASGMKDGGRGPTVDPGWALIGISEKPRGAAAGSVSGRTFLGGDAHRRPSESKPTSGGWKGCGRGRHRGS